jgi:acetyltransferase-like isoleucine patch superfamily enzyme
MSLFGHILSLFPLFHGVGVLLSFGVGIRFPGECALGLFVGVIYLLPLVLFRLHRLIAPQRGGISILSGGRYSPWYGGHQFQLPFIAFPVYERALRLVPGLFSLWLRAWGSRVGRGVYWTPHLAVADRDLLEIGNGVVMGHQVALSSHLISPDQDKNMVLFVRKIRVLDGAFVGAGVVIGPGVVVSENVVVKAGTQLHPRKKVTA